MKSKILFSLLLFFTCSIKAQENFIDFGIKAGLNISNLNSSNNNYYYFATTTTPRFAFHFGGFARINLNKHFAVQEELTLSLQGAKEYYGGWINYENLNYINFPVLFQYKFKNGVTLQTGPQLGFLINQRDQGPILLLEDDGSFGGLVDLSFDFGANYISKWGVGLDARYNYGLTQASPLMSDMYNRVFQFGIFYQFKQRPQTISAND